MGGGDESGKIFVGGLSWDTDQDSLQNHFSQFGEITDCTVIMNPETGKSRGFGFVSFRDPSTVQVILSSQSHVIDGRTVDAKACAPKGAAPRSQNRFSSGGGGGGMTGRTTKIFIGGLPNNVEEDTIRECFSQFGNVTEVVIMYDQEKQRQRGFGFLTFDNEDSVEQACAEHFVDVNGKQVECKKAAPRGAAPGRGGGTGGRGGGRGGNRGGYGGGNQGWNQGASQGNWNQGGYNQQGWNQQQDWNQGGQNNGWQGNQGGQNMSYGGGYGQYQQQGGGGYGANQQGGYGGQQGGYDGQQGGYSGQQGGYGGQQGGYSGQQGGYDGQQSGYGGQQGGYGGQQGGYGNQQGGYGASSQGANQDMGGGYQQRRAPASTGGGNSRGGGSQNYHPYSR